MTESSTGAPSGETTATSRTAPSTPSGAVATPQRAATLKTEHGTTVIAFVEDPDGYKIELIQRKN